MASMLDAGSLPPKIFASATISAMTRISAATASPISSGTLRPAAQSGVLLAAEGRPPVAGAIG
jgi:hypothetical protein